MIIQKIYNFIKKNHLNNNNKKINSEKLYELYELQTENIYKN